jgi:hypothetical protein
MFPHERVYLARVRQGAEDIGAVQAGTLSTASAKGFKEPGVDLFDTGLHRYEDIVEAAADPSLASTDLEDWLADIGTTASDLADKLSPAHTVALAGYTGGMHALLNAVMTLPAPAAKLALQSRRWEGQVEVMVMRET